MDRIDKYKRVEEDQLQGKGKEKIILQKGRDFRLDRCNNNSPRRDFVGQYGLANTQKVNTVFRKPVPQVSEKIKNEPFFKWPNKMAEEEGGGKFGRRKIKLGLRRFPKSILYRLGLY